ncbi:MAG TPA: M48 family metalloprotease [Pseudomonadales bacterium]|nr:M48 family metalloprotease [Pseudomonadales bacterium]
MATTLREASSSGRAGTARSSGVKAVASRWRVTLVAPLLLALVACVQNPVTGKSELGLIATSDEIAIGGQQYSPSQQMQGGVYVSDPELGDYVSRVGRRLAAVSDRDLPYEFVVLNSSVPNAWALPGGKIAINRGLLTELDSEAELAAVLGHEITHAAARHGAQAMERGMLTQGALAAASVAIGVSGYGDYSDLALGAAQVGAQLMTQKYGRDAERESDRYGMIYMKRAGYDPAAAVDLQQTFVRLSEGRSSDWLSGLFSSHPPSQERVDNNRAFAAELGTGGEVGREAYQAATANLRRKAPAYELADAARKALAEKQWDTALAKAEGAIKKVPAEAGFHALAGDAHYGAKRYQKALQEYDRAVELDGSYYANWQRRGMVNLELDRDAEAKRDLERAVALLPTAQSMNALGQLALAAGRTTDARAYLSAAADSDSGAGSQARTSLARLDLSAQPQRYVPVRYGLDGNGEVIAELRNDAPFAVTGLVLELRVREANGQVASRRLPVDGTFSAGAVKTLRTGIRLPAATAANALDLRVVAAREAR